MKKTEKHRINIDDLSCIHRRRRSKIGAEKRVNMSVFTVIVCDKCGTSITSEDGNIATEESARGQGWFLGINDLCPSCCARFDVNLRHRIFRDRPGHRSRFHPAIYVVACPTCNAEVEYPCRTDNPRGGEKVPIHATRVKAAQDATITQKLKLSAG